MYVDFEYAYTRTDTLLPVTVTPTLTGLQGHTPVCTLAQGALPPGLVLNSNCTVAGVPTAGGNFTAVVRLTSPGVKGSVDADVGFRVDDPTPPLEKRVATGGPVDVSLTTSQALASTPLVQLGMAHVPQSQDIVTYQIAAGTLPAGLSFDAADGSISGIPTGFGAASISVTATLSRNGANYVTAPVVISLDVGVTPLNITYPLVCNAPVGVALTCAPVASNFAPLPGSRLVFTADGLPAGFSIDPDSGTITGVAGGSNTQIQITAVATLPDGTTMRAQPHTTLQALKSLPVYTTPAATTFGFTAGPYPTGLGGVEAIVATAVAFAADVDFVTSTVAGDVFSYALLAHPDGAYPLPTWLAIDASTGRLTGTPPAVAGYAAWRIELTVRRNGQDHRATQDWFLTIR